MRKESGVAHIVVEKTQKNPRLRHSTSLRWYYPDQVLRVSKAHFDLSLSKGPPSGLRPI
jgi:hypothetical protein